MQQWSFVQVTAKFQLKSSVKGTERRPVCTQQCKILNGNTIAIANLQLQTYWVPHSQPEIGGVWTLRTLALWMYGQCVHKNVKYEEY